MQKPENFPLAKRDRLQKLIEAVGGKEKLEEWVYEFYQVMAKDVLIDFFFQGRDLRAISSQQAGFLLKAAGMNDAYTGKTPDRAHDAIPPILKGHFDRRIFILENFLKKKNLIEVHAHTWVSFERAFEKVIVSRE